MCKYRCYENDLLTQSDLFGGFPQFGKLPGQTFFKVVCVVLFCAYPYSFICLFVPNIHGLCFCLRAGRHRFKRGGSMDGGSDRYGVFLCALDVLNAPTTQPFKLKATPAISMSGTNYLQKHNPL